MKSLKYNMLLGALLGLASCQETEYQIFNDLARVQMGQTSIIRSDFFYTDKAIVRDTVYVRVQTIGGPADHERKINFVQVSEYDYEYVYDEKGNVVDTVKTELLNKAVPGVHYVPMDDPEMQNLLVVPAHAVAVNAPVILLRDPSLRKEEVRLCIRLAETEDFLLGESDQLNRTIIFADKLSKPNFWNKTIERYYFGKYSSRKHEFMYQVAGEKITDEWYKRVSQDYSEMRYYQTKFSKALAAYNADEENIKSGLAPMREDQDDSNSPLVVFPK